MHSTDTLARARARTHTYGQYTDEDFRFYTTVNDKTRNEIRAQSFLQAAMTVNIRVSPSTVNTSKLEAVASGSKMTPTNATEERPEAGDYLIAIDGVKFATRWMHEPSCLQLNVRMCVGVHTVRNIHARALGRARAHVGRCKMKSILSCSSQMAPISRCNTVISWTVS